MLPRRWRDVRDLLAELGIWLAVVGCAVYLTFEFDEPLQVYRFSAAAWPRVILAALLIGTLAQFFFGVRERLRQEHAQAPDGYWSQLKEAGLHMNLRLLGMFALPLVYVFLLPRTGYYVTTPFLLSAYMWLMGEHRVVHLVGTSLFVYGLSLLIFGTLLFVPLPTGNWPGFYDFSNWLLVLIR